MNTLHENNHFAKNIKVQPLTLVDTLEPVAQSKPSFISKILNGLFKSPDLSLNQWESLEAKPRPYSSREYEVLMRKGGL
jgi:hypothetical protein